MAEEKKGFWAKLMGTKKASGCCSVKIEEIPEDAPAGTETAETENAETGKEAESAPCCGGGPTPRRGGGGGCCG